MTQEQLYQRFMEFVETNYDGLAYVWQFSDWKRLKMDRASYLKLAATYFENYYPSEILILPTEHSLFQLISDFHEDVEILEVISRRP